MFFNRDPPALCSQSCFKIRNQKRRKTVFRLHDPDKNTGPVFVRSHNIYYMILFQVHHV